MTTQVRMLILLSLHSESTTVLAVCLQAISGLAMLGRCCRGTASRINTPAMLAKYTCSCFKKVAAANHKSPMLGRASPRSCAASHCTSQSKQPRSASPWRGERESHERSSKTRLISLSVFLMQAGMHCRSSGLFAYSRLGGGGQCASTQIVMQARPRSKHALTAAVRPNVRSSASAGPVVRCHGSVSTNCTAPGQPAGHPSTKNRKTHAWRRIKALYISASRLRCTLGATMRDYHQVHLARTPVLVLR